MQAEYYRDMRALEKHYSPQEDAELWGLSDNTVRRLFEDEPKKARSIDNATPIETAPPAAMATPAGTATPAENANPPRGGGPSSVVPKPPVPPRFSVKSADSPEGQAQLAEHPQRALDDQAACLSLAHFARPTFTRP